MTTMVDVVNSINLLEILQNGRRIFGSAEVSISLETDAEDITWESIVLTIHTDLGVDESLDLLDRFDSEYWLDQNVKDMIVTIEAGRVDGINRAMCDNESR